MSYGDVDTVRDLLGLSEGEEEAKMTRFLSLANTWLDTRTSSDVLSDLGSSIKNMAVNFYTIYLFRLASERFSGAAPDFATQWRDEAETILRNGMFSEGDIYKLRKVNDGED